MGTGCLKFMEAEISKTLRQKGYDPANCWLLKGNRGLGKVRFRKNTRDMTGT